MYYSIFHCLKNYGTFEDFLPKCQERQYNICTRRDNQSTEYLINESQSEIDWKMRMGMEIDDNVLREGKSATSRYPQRGLDGDISILYHTADITSKNNLITEKVIHLWWYKKKINWGLQYLVNWLRWLLNIRSLNRGSLESIKTWNF